MRESGLWMRETLALRASVSIERNVPHFAGANNLATDGSAYVPGVHVLLSAQTAGARSGQRMVYGKRRIGHPHAHQRQQEQ